MAVNRLLTLKDYERRVKGRQETLDKPKPKISWKAVIAIIGILFTISTTVAFAEFMFEEAAQQAGFGIFMCSSAIKAANDDNLDPMLKVCQANLAQARKLGEEGRLFTERFGWIMPLNWASYRAYWRGFMSNLDTQELGLQVLAAKQDKAAGNETVKNCARVEYKYDYQVWEFQENKVKASEVQAKLDQMAAAGWHVEDSYVKIVGKTWWKVYVFEKIVLVEVKWQVPQFDSCGLPPAEGE